MIISANLTGIIISLGLCVVLPAIVVWLITRKKTNETNKRTEILLAALEKNVNIDTDAIAKMMAEPSKKNSIKKSLLNRLLTGCILTFVGLALLVDVFVQSIASGTSLESLHDLLAGGAFFGAIGIAFLLNYFVGKHFLAKEIEREENNLPEQENDTHRVHSTSQR